MAVYAPGDDDPNASQQPVDPNLFQRLLGYVNPVGSANASVLHPSLSNPNLYPFGNPAPIGSNPPTPPITDPRARAIADAQAQLNAGNARSSNAPPTLGPQAPIQSAATIPTALPPNAAPPAAPPFQQPAHPSTMRFPMWPTPPVPTAAPAAPLPPSRPVTPTPATAYPAAPAAVQPARPVTPTPATAYSPAFGGIDRQNLSATGWNPGTRQGTALDLSRMFGMPSDMNPPSAQPVSGGVLSKAGTKGLTGKVPLPPVMPADIRRQRAIQLAAAHSGFA
jgi:hypothetical protein